MTYSNYGELLFSLRMKNRGHQVTNVTWDADYQIKDIDFIIDGTITYEVKWDSKINDTGNLYLELTNVNSKQWNGEGWWKRCQADYLVYGDAQTETFYTIPLAELRQIVAQMELKKASCGRDSTGLLLPLHKIQDIATIL